MNVTRNRIRKIILIAGILLIFAAAMLVLNHTAQNGRKTIEMLPEIVDEPVYVECEEGESLEVTLKAKEDFSIAGFWLLMVNISEESRGTVRIAVTDDASNLLLNQVLPVETITPGKWFLVPSDINFIEGEEYQVSILADGSQPYFMQVPKEGEEKLPFEETVTKKGEAAGCGISLGVNVVEDVAVTYGEILYYSIPLCVLAAIFSIICVLFGYKNVCERIRKIPFDRFFQKYGSDLFLILLFGAICVSVYARAYLKGVYISADSAGYLREAVNLTEGKGFHYDGLAGYDSWFANWPIVYPAMIALVMVITKANAYLASKILTMIIVGVILLVLRFCFKKDAWVYGLCLTNIGFLNLAYYTWSEIPFMLFMLGFALVLAKILKAEDVKAKWYIALGGMGLGCFLTRYFGIYVWIVVGCYILYLLAHYFQKRDKKVMKKALGLTVTAFLAGSLSMAYLLMNKLMNGMASGVSRTMWWDDYEKLTNDLIESLLTEFFHIFSLQIPELIEGFTYPLKVFVLVVILIGLICFVRKNCRHFCRESVMITMAVMYYLIFIVIRYFSSMDTFYFRFFEPATFLLCIGLIGLLLPYLRGKKGFQFFAGAVSVIIIIAVLSVFENGGMEQENGYYVQLVGQWDKAYSEIPEKSVIIFNDIDFRSSYYRPDVMEGTITPKDTLSSIQNTYYGSDYLCIRAEFANVMLESGEYDESINKWLRSGLENQGEEGAFLILSLKNIDSF